LWWRGNKHISSSQRMKWKKVIKITHQYVPWQCLYSLINVTFSYSCTHHEGIWDTEEVQLHTLLTLYSCILCPRTISWPLFKYVNLPSPPQHLISYQMELVTFTPYIPWYPYFYGLQIFSITYPHSLPLRGTLALHECVWSASHSTWVPYEQEARQARGSPEEVKNPLTLPGT
jgi:hypothetical protein